MNIAVNMTEVKCKSKGKTFGEVLLLKEFKLQNGKHVCYCRCSCGNEFLVNKHTLFAKNYKGHCGCKPHAGKGSKHKFSVRNRTHKLIEDPIKIKLIDVSISTKSFMQDILNGKYDIGVNHE